MDNTPEILPETCISSTGEKPKTLKRKRHPNQEKITCSYCLKDITRKNFKRHQSLCKEHALGDGDGSICEKCGARYLKEARLKYHVKSCIGVCKSGKIRCTFKECNVTFLKKMSLIKHLKMFHKYEVKDPEIHNFSSIDEFEKWKEKEEEATFSFFVKRNGEQKGHIYYYCQHDGPSKPHSRKDEPGRLTERRHKKGQIKADNVCIAMIQLTLGPDKSCSVKYFPTHNHPLSESDLVHHRQSRQIYSLIDEQLAMDISPNDIVSYIKEHFGNDDSIKNKALLISKKLVRERARRMKKAILKNTQLNFEIANTIFLDCCPDIDSIDACNAVETDSTEQPSCNFYNDSNPNSQKNCDEQSENNVQVFMDFSDLPTGIEFLQDDVTCIEEIEVLPPSNQEVSVQLVEGEVLSQNNNDVTVSTIVLPENTIEKVSDTSTGVVKDGAASNEQNIEVLSPENTRKRTLIVEDIKQSCRTLIALTDFMSTEVLNLAFSSIDELVRHCEGLIDSEDDSKPNEKL